MQSLATVRAQKTLAGSAALVVAGLWPLVEALRIVAGSGHAIYLTGDQALLALGARRAWHAAALLGPYSRFGWHHPGPELLYILALPVRLFEPTGPGLYLGTVLINGVASVAVVAFTWRRYGRHAGLWSAVVMDGLCLALSLVALRYPWNPYLIVLPLVLFALLWADAISGGLGSLAWWAAVGSYGVQTHLAGPARRVVDSTAIRAISAERLQPHVAGPAGNFR